MGVEGKWRAAADRASDSRQFLSTSTGQLRAFIASFGLMLRFVGRPQEHGTFGLECDK